MKARMQRMIARLRHLAHRYGPIWVVGAAFPIFLYLGYSLANAEIVPVEMMGKPWGGAIRAEAGPEASGVTHVKTPAFVKGLYVTAATVADKPRFEALLALAERTEINALVIDIKNGKGEIAFEPRSSALKNFAEARPSIRDLDALTQRLHEKNIYLIARDFVFQDPSYVAKHPEWAVHNPSGGVWRDRRGTPWLDPAAPEVWKYNSALAKEAYGRGFDEVQFDYIRFPSDGLISAIRYPVYDGKTPKYEVMGRFFAFLDSDLRIKNAIPISVDLFGLTMWQFETDMNIGQRLAEALPHFDYISPMVYPSHYPPGFNGYANPALFPYEVVYGNLERARHVFEAAHAAAADSARVRPWIQDFNLGANYTADMVRAQMRATVDGGGTGWLMWNARNVYTESALQRKK